MGGFFISYISQSYILHAKQWKINSRRRGLTGWRSWRARSQFLKEGHESLFLVVRRNIWRDLLVVHEERKISSIVMIQSSRSSYRGYIHRFWYLGKLMNLIYHEIVFFNFHSRHIRKLITLSFPLAWEGLLIYMPLPYDQFKIVLYIQPPCIL